MPLQYHSRTWILLFYFLDNINNLIIKGYLNNGVLRFEKREMLNFMFQFLKIRYKKVEYYRQLFQKKKNEE